MNSNELIDLQLDIEQKYGKKHVNRKVRDAIEQNPDMTVKIKDGAEYVGSNGAIRMRIQSTPAAIGYAGLGFVDKTVKALEINGVFPTPDTVTTGEYPISRPLFMFTNGYPKLGSNTHAFVTLYLSEKGQEIIEDIGFVPVTKY